MVSQPGQRLLSNTEEVWRVVQGQSFVSSIMCLLFFVVYNRGLQHEEVWRVVQGQSVFCIGYNVPTLFRSLQQRSLALSKHVTHYGPRSGFLYYNLITHNTSTPLQTYDQRTPQSSSVGLMPGNRLQCSLFSKNNIYISNKEGIKQWALLFLDHQYCLFFIDLQLLYAL